MIGDRLNPSARPDFWRSRAACKGKPTWWFFPAEQGYNWQPPREALELCAACPVQPECARAGKHEYGVWGGVFHPERGSQRIRRFELEREVAEFGRAIDECEADFGGFVPK